LIIAGMTFMSAVSASIGSAATQMAQILVLIALLTGLGSAAKAADDV